MGRLCRFDIDGDSGVAIGSLIQTRSVMLGDNDLTSSYRVVLRGLLNGEPGTYSGLYVMGSLDGVRWMYLGGTELMHRNGIPIRDIGTTIERNSCKMLMVVYVGRLYNTSRIDNIDITSNIRYNYKIR